MKKEIIEHNSNNNNNNNNNYNDNFKVNDKHF